MRFPLAAAFALALMGSSSAEAADTVKVAYAKLSNALPYFVAIDKGLFKKYDIELESVVINVSSMQQSALLANQVEVGVGLLAVEGMTGNVAKPGSINYVVMNAQTASHRMEQFVVRKDFPAKTIADLKGAKLVCAPGIGNVAVAKAALAEAGLKEGDYTLDQLDIAQHINVLTSGQYDGAYTLEPGGTMINERGVGRTIMAGVIAKTVLGDPEANAYVAGTVFTGTFLKERKDVAARFAKAMGEAIAFINANPAEARKTLVGNTPIAEEIVPKMPIMKFSLVSDMSDKDKANVQTYIDYATKIGAMKTGIEVKPYLVSF